VKVTLAVSPYVDVDVQRDPDGQITAVVFKPRFASPTGTVVLAECTSHSDGGRQLDAFELLASGASGRVAKKNRGEAVTAAVDAAEKPATKADAPAKPPEQKADAVPVKPPEQKPAAGPHPRVPLPNKAP
jgi:hypothetical protein